MEILTVFSIEEMKALYHEEIGETNKVVTMETAYVCPDQIDHYKWMFIIFVFFIYSSCR